MTSEAEIEAAARALCIAIEFDPDESRTFGVPHWTTFIDHACAALTAAEAARGDAAGYIDQPPRAVDLASIEAAARACKRLGDSFAERTMALAAGAARRCEQDMLELLLRVVPPKETPDA